MTERKEGGCPHPKGREPASIIRGNLDLRSVAQGDFSGAMAAIGDDREARTTAPFRVPSTAIYPKGAEQLYPWLLCLTFPMLAYPTWLIPWFSVNQEILWLVGDGQSRSWIDGIREVDKRLSNLNHDLAPQQQPEFRSIPDTFSQVFFSTPRQRKFLTLSLS